MCNRVDARDSSGGHTAHRFGQSAMRFRVLYDIETESIFQLSGFLVPGVFVVLSLLIFLAAYHADRSSERLVRIFFWPLGPKVHMIGAAVLVCAGVGFVFFLPYATYKDWKDLSSAVRSGSCKQISGNVHSWKTHGSSETFKVGAEAFSYSTEDRIAGYRRSRTLGPLKSGHFIRILSCNGRIGRIEVGEGYE